MGNLLSRDMGAAMRPRRLIVILVLIGMVCVSSSRAEIYRGIGPLDSLADVKARLPGATYERLQPAWGQPEDAMYKITGRGISGIIVIKFYDPRPTYRRLLADERDSEKKRLFEGIVRQSEEEALGVDWVRWIPEDLIPLQRFISKYGQPDKSGFADEDMQPYRSWITKGLTAYLSDSESFVIRVDFDFTREERRQAYQAKYGFVPEHLK